MRVIARVWGVLLATLVVGAAWGQFLIVPQGERAGSVQPKALKAEMHAWGAFATARLELTFATDPNWSDEVDFLMRLPENTEATGFAYWFGEEYVPAKTVEKARAQAIYQFITERRRDPALVEMVGRRQFRVRIAPVDVESDLRVEIRLVITPTRGALELPLAQLIDRQLASVDLTLTTPGSGWRENWGLQPTLRDGRAVVRFASKPWKPRANWRATQGAAVTVSSGRPEKGEGTLLVAYTAKSDQTNVRLIAPKGVLAHVYPRVVARLRQGETVTFAARIAAGAPAAARLTVGGTTWTQALPRSPMTPREGVVVWGARHVAALKDRDAIRRWGLWLGIPTKETSWLAVPQAEIEALKDAREDLAARDYWLQVSKDGASSAKARAARAELASLVASRTSPPDQTAATLEWRLQIGRWRAVSLLTDQFVIAVERFGMKSSQSNTLGAALDRLEAALSKEPNMRWYEGLLASALEQVESSLVDRALGDEASPATPTELAKIKSTLKAVLAEPRFRDRPGDAQLPWTIADALATGEALDANEPGLQATSAARRRIAVARELMPLYGAPERLRRDARSAAAANVYGRLIADWAYGRPNEPRAPIESLIARIDRVVARYRITRDEVRPALIQSSEAFEHAHDYYRRDWDPSNLPFSDASLAIAKHYGIPKVAFLRDRFNEQLESWKWEYLSLYNQTVRDPIKLKEAKAKLEAWAHALQRTAMQPQELTQDVYYSSRARNDYVEALRRFGPQDARTGAARKAMEREDAANGRTQRVPYRGEILEREIELDALMWRSLSAEEAARRAELEAQVKDLRARMGDPLIVVDAPRDPKVSARLPDGRLVRLTWNAQTMRWEHRFDLPPGTPEGSLSIPIWVRTPNGQTETREMRVQVDQTAPRLQTTWTRTANGWRLQALTGADVARVDVALPDGRRLPVQRIGANADGARWLVEIEGALTGEAIVIATDGAHNRMEDRTCLTP